MAEIGPFQLETKRAMPDGPSLGQITPLGPNALFIFASLEAGVGASPGIGIRLLERLGRRAWSVQRDRAEPFQPPAGTKIKKLIILVLKH